MKKLLLLSFALVFFSCANDEPITNKSGMDKETTTIDNGIGYFSPYKYNGINFLEYGSINYYFINNTDLTFHVTPYFGLAYYLPNYNPFPNGVANGQEYGNYINATEFKVNPYTDRILSSVIAVPTIEAYSDVGIANDYFDFPNYANERGELVKRGKIFYIEFSIGNSSTIGKVKIPFPIDINSTTGLPNPWLPVGKSDSVFSDELVYNTLTKEVCSTISSSGAVKDYLKFTYNGNDYIVRAQINEIKVIYTLSRL